MFVDCDVRCGERAVRDTGASVLRNERYVWKMTEKLLYEGNERLLFISFDTS